tara:strand:+ start:3276 stop:7286 length:4011 start_codon:yes stop_codon:yes gene_type:complete
MNKKNTSGGAAGAGGMNFQSTATAIAFVHCLRGTPLMWLEDLAHDIPNEISAETGGPGDDIAITLTNGQIAEAQVKKGLRKTQEFWDAIDNLATGIRDGRCTYGLLLVCPNTSGTIRNEMATSIRRIADGRDDSASASQTELTTHLTSKGFDAKAICSHLRIKTVSALSAQPDGIKAAHAELGHICKSAAQIDSAWNILEIRADQCIERKGRHTASSLLAALQAQNIDIRSSETGSPAAVIKSLLEWTLETTKEFTIPGVTAPLALDSAWLELDVIPDEKKTATSHDINDALAAYHSWEKRFSNAASDRVNAKTLGTFRRRCVVVGGPGSGKSLLSKILCRQYAKEGIPALRISIRDLAQRIHASGCTVEEGILALSLDGSGIPPASIQDVLLNEVVLICDGLDESANYQEKVAEGLRAFVASHPQCRVIVTTRPVGYDRSFLKNWRHYEVAPPEQDLVSSITTLVEATGDVLFGDDQDLTDKISAFVKGNEAKDLIRRNPLLVGFAAALFLQDTPIGRTKTDLYEQIFALIDQKPTLHTNLSEKASHEEKISLLNCLGWVVTTDPVIPKKSAAQNCADWIMVELGIPALEARSRVDETFRYWEAKGLIETIHHGSQTLVTFVHKSCGEFAAARHLADLSQDVARELIQQDLDSPDWSEILDFTTRTNAAPLLAEIILDQSASERFSDRWSERALYVLSKVEHGIPEEKVTFFFEHLIKEINSPDRQRAYNVGGQMLNASLEKLPDLIKRLQEADQFHPWSTLIIDSLLAQFSIDHFGQDRLRQKYLHYLGNAENDELLVRPKEFFLGDRYDHKLFQSFILKALAHLLKNQTIEFQDILLEPLGGLENLQTMGFVAGLETVLLSVGRRDALTTLNITMPKMPWHDLKMPEFNRGNRQFYDSVIAGPFYDAHDGAVDAPADGSLKYLSALIDQLGCMEAPAYDVRVWEDDKSYAEEADIIRKCAYIFDLPLDKLAKDAASFQKSSAELEDQNLFRALSYFPRVDVDEIDWSKARNIDFDNQALERLIHHKSRWFKIVIAQILDARIDECQREDLLKRLLCQGRGDTLHIAAALGHELPQKRCAQLVLEHLKSKLQLGCEHLYGYLKEQNHPISINDMNAINNGLFSDRVRTACAAADWVLKRASAELDFLVPALWQAYDHWKHNEEPSSQSGGVIPDSPREELLKAIQAITPMPYESLREHFEDSRRDVRKLARELALEQAEVSSEIAAKMADDICKKRLDVDFYNTLSHRSDILEKVDISGLLVMLSDSDPMYRRASLNLLSPQLMPLNEAIELARNYTTDKDGSVRDAAFRRLQTLNQTITNSSRYRGVLMPFGR